MRLLHPGGVLLDRAVAAVLLLPHLLLRGEVARRERLLRRCAGAARLRYHAGAAHANASDSVPWRGAQRGTKFSSAARDTEMRENGGR